MTAMNPAELFAAAKAVESGLKAALPRLQKGAAEYAELVGADRLRAGRGSVTVVAPKPRIAAVDDRQLLEWCRENAAHLIKEQVDSVGLRQLCDKQLAVADDGETVIDKFTGEVVGWAKVQTRPTYLTVRLPESVKYAAETEITVGLQAMAGVLDAIGTN